MDWTEAHLDQLAADIAADPTLSTLPHNGDSAVVVAHQYNLPAAPDFWVWRTSLGQQEIYEATTSAGTKWNWATYKSQSVQDRDAWERMMAPGVVNPSLEQTRAGWDTIFGTQGASLQQVNFLLALGRRKATRTEKLYADTAQGAGTTAAPATMVFEGALSPSLVEQAWSE